MSTRNPNDSDNDEKMDQNQRCELWTVGDNRHGQQLNGTTKDVKQLLQIQNIKNKNIKTIHTMTGGATFAIYDDNEMCVGGYNGYGQLGVGSNHKLIMRMHHLDFKVNLISKGIASNHVIIQKQNNALCSAGLNMYNQCGINSKSNQLREWTIIPPIPNNPAIKTIATGSTFTIFLSRHGIMFACGLSSYGALGMGANTTKVLTATIIDTKTRMEQIAAGEHHCVGISRKGAFSWGANNVGQCG
eukprot:308410_1